jgi:hypothetical protein
VTEQQQQTKLEQIARQDANDTIGWYRAIFVSRRRPSFDGEAAALTRRARELGIDLSKHREAI